MYKFLRTIFRYHFFTGLLVLIPFTITTAFREAYLMRRLKAPKMSWYKMFWGHLLNNWMQLTWTETGKWFRKKWKRIQLFRNTIINKFKKPVNAEN